MDLRVIIIIIVCGPGALEQADRIYGKSQEGVVFCMILIWDLKMQEKRCLYLCFGD